MAVQAIQQPPHRAAPSKLPDAIRIPDFLHDYLLNLQIPDPITLEFLLQIGIDVLQLKVADVENYNMAIKAGKKRIPEKLDFEDVAIILMSLFTFRNIQMTERTDDTILAFYVDSNRSNKKGTYNTNIRAMFEIMERLAPNFKNKDMEDVIDKIERSVLTVEQTKDRHLFIVNNGVYNQRLGRLMDFNPNFVYLTKIPVDYVQSVTNPVITAPDGYQWDVESWIADLAEEADTTELIWQVIADCMQPSHSRHKSIWFYSEKGNNGKGTIGQLIKNLLGKGNYSSLSVADFNHEFLKETLLGAGANIADENDVDIYIDSIKDYKASITGDDINVNRKYEKPLRIQFLGTNIQMMNGLPKTKDKSDSFYRRLILVPFLKSFTNNGERKYIKNDYINRTDVLQYVLYKVLQMDFEEYIMPASSALLMESYKEKNNPVLEFWNELKDEFVWDLLPTKFLFDLYKKWSEVNNPSGTVMSKRSFSDNLTAVIHALGDPWEVKTTQKDNIRSTPANMGQDEPLITEYGLDMPDRGGKPTEWMKVNSAATNPVTRRAFTRKAMYRGYLRQ